MSNQDTLCGHKIIRDHNQIILGWYKPETPGAVYSKVVQLASEFIKDVPNESNTGLPMYLVTCCFHGPHMTDGKNIIPERWPHNPACVYAGSVQSLAVKYRVYTGDDSYLKLVQEMLDYQLVNGTTPESWIWPSVPYASADPFSKIYQGAMDWEYDGMRGDGLHNIEPDKVGELGYGYLCFYEITNDNKYLNAAIKCADALAKHIRNVTVDTSSFAKYSIKQSPWPFRVNARTGVVKSEYCSNVLEPIKLIDELMRISDKINLTYEQLLMYKKAIDIAWSWLFSKAGPMTTFIWNGYFEDIPNDPDISNRLQITPIEIAKYLILHPEKDRYIDKDVPSLINWVASAFKTESLDAIKEQTWCYEPMGSHTARFGSVCALYFERMGNPWYKEQAFRFMNVASYMTYENGVVTVGPNWPGSWFSDGYSDYIRHFFDAMAAIPEWAPAGEDHLLRSSSIVQSIDYQSNQILFNTFDDVSKVVLRLDKKPISICINGKKIEQRKVLETNTWTWTSLNIGGIVGLYYTCIFRPMLTTIPVDADHRFRPC
jgi:hypothetical protein